MNPKSNEIYDNTANVPFSNTHYHFAKHVYKWPDLMKYRWDIKEFLFLPIKFFYYYHSKNIHFIKFRLRKLFYLKMENEKKNPDYWNCESNKEE